MNRLIAPLAALALLGACAPAGMPPDALSDPLAAADTVDAVPFGPAFRDARAAGIDPQGNFYVADAGADIVVLLTPAGAPVGTLGGSGTGDYAFLAPAGVDPTNGLVLVVADRDNGRVQRFSNEGRLLETVIVPADPLAVLGRRVEAGERGRPTAVISAPAGELFAVEDRRGVVLLWDERRSLQRVIGQPQDGRGALRQPGGLALAPDGRLFVADAAHGAVLVYDAFGEFLRRIADGTAPGARDVAISRESGASGTRLAIVLPRHVLIYDLHGNRQRVIAPATDGPLVGAAFAASGELVVLTRTRLWWVG